MNRIDRARPARVHVHVLEPDEQRDPRPWGDVRLRVSCITCSCEQRVWVTNRNPAAELEEELVKGSRVYSCRRIDSYQYLMTAVIFNWRASSAFAIEWASLHGSDRGP